jgi:hypothetical protein
MVWHPAPEEEDAAAAGDASAATVSSDAGAADGAVPAAPSTRAVPEPAAEAPNDATSDLAVAALVKDDAAVVSEGTTA